MQRYRGQIPHTLLQRARPAMLTDNYAVIAAIEPAMKGPRVFNVMVSMLCTGWTFELVASPLSARCRY